MQHHFILGLGSNIEPAPNTVAMVEALLDLAGHVVISRIVETAPVDITGDGTFYNLCACITTGLDPATVQAHLHQVEQKLGRVREDPNRKRKSRPADLDILIVQPPGRRTVSLTDVPDEAYLRPMLLELIYALGLECAESLPTLPAGVPLILRGITIGRGAMRIERTPEGQVRALALAT